jgi:hypothetical protein
MQQATRSAWRASTKRSLKGVYDAGGKHSALLGAPSTGGGGASLDAHRRRQRALLRTRPLWLSQIVPVVQKSPLPLAELRQQLSEHGVERKVEAHMAVLSKRIAAAEAAMAAQRQSLQHQQQQLPSSAASPVHQQRGQAINKGTSADCAQTIPGSSREDSVSAMVANAAPAEHPQLLEVHPVAHSAGALPSPTSAGTRPSSAAGFGARPLVSARPGLDASRGAGGTLKISLGVEPSEELAVLARDVATSLLQVHHKANTYQVRSCPALRNGKHCVCITLYITLSTLQANAVLTCICATAGRPRRAHWHMGSVTLCVGMPAVHLRAL